MVQGGRLTDDVIGVLARRFDMMADVFSNSPSNSPSNSAPEPPQISFALQRPAAPDLP
jgi:hypothetical protein